MILSPNMLSSTFSGQPYWQVECLSIQILPSVAYKTICVHRSVKGLLSEIPFINTNLEGLFAEAELRYHGI